MACAAAFIGDGDLGPDEDGLVINSHEYDLVIFKIAHANAGAAAFLRCAVALVPLVPMLVHETRRRGSMPLPLPLFAVAAGFFLRVDYVMWTINILDIGTAIFTVLINVQVIVFPLLARIFNGTCIPRRFLWACRWCPRASRLGRQRAGIERTYRAPGAGNRAGYRRGQCVRDLPVS